MAHYKSSIGQLCVNPESTFSTAASAAYSDYLSVPAEGIQLALAQPLLERAVQTGVFGQGVSGKVGPKGGSFKFRTGIPGCSTAGASGVAAVLEVWLKECLEACALATNADTGTVITGSGSTTTVLDVTDASTIDIGSLVMVGGEVRLVTAKNVAATPDNITVTPALSSIPSAATVVHAGVTITTSDGDPGTATFVFKGDGYVYRMKGCKGTAKLVDAEAGARPMIEWDFQVDDWDDTEPSGTFPSRVLSNHIKTATGGALLWGTASAASPVYTFDWGRTLTPKASPTGSQGRIGWAVTAQKPVVGLKPYFSTSYATDFAAETERTMLFQIGATAQATFAVFVPKAQIAAGQFPTDVNGLVGHDITLQVNDAQQSTLAEVQWAVF